MKKTLMFKVEKGKLYSATKQKGETKNVGTCPYCGNSVYVSPGQLLVYRNNRPTHKRCRK